MSDSTLEMGNRPGRETIPLWGWPNLVSLDAPLVAIVWQAAIASALDVPLPWYHVWILGSAVWLVYVADRLLDARRLDVARGHALRHAFHRRFQRTFIIAWAVVMLMVVVVAIRCLTRVEWLQGGAVSGAVIAYAAYVHLGGDRTRRLAKESLAGMVFALGVSLPSWGAHSAGSLFVIALLSGGLCSWNCLLIASWERDSDRAQRFASLPQAVPGVSRLYPAIGSLLAALAWGAVAIGNLAADVALMVTLSCLALGSLDRKGALLPGSLRGALADAALLTPVLGWWPW